MKRSGLITVPAVCVFILALMFSMELAGIGSSSPGNSRENPDKITDKKNSLKLISHNGEEVLYPGEKFLITWESQQDIEKVNLEYSPDNGTSFQPIVDNIPNTGSYEWQVPHSFVCSGIIRISKVDKQKLSPGQLSYQLKFKISGDESSHKIGEIFTIYLGDERHNAIGFDFNDISFSRGSNDKACIRFNDIIKEIGPFNQFLSRWHDVQVLRDSSYDQFSIILDGTLIFENIPHPSDKNILYALSFSVEPNHSNVEIDDVAIQGLYKPYDKERFITFFREDFERFVEGKITINSGWIKTMRMTSDKFEYGGEIDNNVNINLDSASGSRTLKIQADKKKQVLVIKNFRILIDIPFDISDQPFAIRDKGDMNRDVMVQNQMKGSPDQSTQGTVTDGFNSTPPTLPGDSRPGLSQPKEMVNTYYIYTFDGKLLAEYDHDGNCVRDFIYFGDRLIAEYRPQTNKYYYYMIDQVNSTRIITDENGNVVFSEAYGPYGDIQKTWVNNYDPKLKFSGKEREGYSGLDYFGARYYDHKSYRFNSVDPLINREEALFNPQLWNLYAYCRNNPITFKDPDGREIGPAPVDALEDYYIRKYAGPEFEEKNIKQRNQIRLYITEAVLAYLITHGLLSPDSPKEEEIVSDGAKRAAGELYKNPDKKPGENWEKRGGEKGNWYNKETGESLRPDLDHSDPVGPHIDYKDKSGAWWRIDSKGNVTKKGKG
jgi:RHS repeat-associated protein